MRPPSRACASTRRGRSPSRRPFRLRSAAPPPPPLERPLRSALKLEPPSPEVLADRAPVEVHNPPPDYPAAARRRGLEGEVVLEIAVLADGTVGEIRVAESSGSRLFVEAAREAVRMWKFLPATLRGAPVAAARRVRFVFRLQG